MIVDLLTHNRFGPRGFVAALQPAALGNALSTLSNMVALNHRTGIPVTYLGLRASQVSEAFSGVPVDDLTVYGDRTSVDLEALVDLCNSVSRWLSVDMSDAGLEASLRRPDQLGELADLRDTVAVVSAPLQFADMEGLEREITRFCARGNGLVLSSPYWTQYMSPPMDVARRVRAILTSGSKPTRLSARHMSDRSRVGLHMRLGDYATWRGGEFFFDRQTYVALLQALGRSWPESEFHVFSDVELMRTDLPMDVRIESFIRGTAADDFHDLARCDVVIGAPSTFATWAAFLGSTRRLVLNRERIGRILDGGDPNGMIVDVPWPNFGYVPGHDGPI